MQNLNFESLIGNFVLGKDFVKSSFKQLHLSWTVKSLFIDFFQKFFHCLFYDKETILLYA